MGIYDSLLKRLPGVSEPKTYLSFKSRIMWTGIILLLFLVLSQITLYGVSATASERFAFLEMILGAKMGTIMTLGIGPIVTASIILQLLVGSKIIPWNLSTPEGRSRFQGTQKLMVILFSVFEAVAYVSFGAVPAADPGNIGMMAFLITQIAFGGFLVLLMDEIVSKWGIGSGVSLFIAAGVSKTIFVMAFSPCVPIAAGADLSGIPHLGSCVLPNPAENMFSTGSVLAAVQLLMVQQMSQALLALIPVIATIVVFVVVTYIQAIYVDIPLAFTSIRGFGRRWPLKFLYTSNIPVILTAALMANLVLVGSIMAKMPAPDNPGQLCGFLGCFGKEDGRPTSGLAFYLSEPRTETVQVFSIIMLVVVFAIAFALILRRFNLTAKIHKLFFALILLTLVGINFMVLWKFGLLTEIASLNVSAIAGLIGLIVADILIALMASIFFKKDSKVATVMLMAILVAFLTAFTITASTFVGLPGISDVVRLVTYLTTFILLCSIFSIFWVSTSGMDAESVSQQIEGLGMQIPGFRRDPRIVKDILNRYIPVLAVLGGVTVGLIAAVADLTGALGTGTGILLTVMIIYNFYEIIQAKHLDEMHPSLRKFFEK